MVFVIIKDPSDIESMKVSVYPSHSLQMTDKKNIERSVELAENNANLGASRNVTKNSQYRFKYIICNQCKFTPSHVGHLGAHLKTHSIEMPNKCNQCNYTSAYASHLQTHLKTHSGEKSNKCSQCEFASFRSRNLRVH